MHTFKKSATLIATACFTAGLLALSGCDNKEKVLDIETPGGEIEVERDQDTGETDVEVND
ncbi:MAG: hypothetical protein R3C59_29120 [Planctomycetaceae bacterium]